MCAKANNFRQTLILIILAFLLFWVSAVHAIDQSSPATRPAAATVKIVLVGDSTVNDHQGWGVAFKGLLKDDAQCVNWAQNGRSSKSFLAEGWWKKALAEKPDYVLIQFGHNDCPGKGPDRQTDPATTYRQYLAQYIDEARAAGATPILVTSMTRRNFSRAGKIVSDLIPYATAASQLAAEKNVPCIDLHARSIALLDQMGPEASAAFDPAPPAGSVPSTRPARPDHTHLSPHGAQVMAKIVAEELRQAVPQLAAYLK